MKIEPGRLGFRALFFLGLAFLTASRVAAYTLADADSLIDAYNAAFLSGQGHSRHYADTQDGGTTYFWGQAEEIEGLIDAYDRTGGLKYRDIMDGLLHGFVQTNGTDWSKNIYNDDCMWACIAFARAYRDTGNDWFLSVARSNFDRVYARAWDSHLDGGLWWTTDNTTKNACVNGPGSIAAYLLYLATGDDGYLAKANAMYDWERAHLFLQATGQVEDGMNARGVLATFPTTYNQGTFVGAADYLGHADDAERAVDFTMNHMGDPQPGGVGNLMPSYGINNNNSGFNGIAIRWIARFVVEHQLQNKFLPWLQANAEAAWQVRRSSDALSWCQWRQQTPPATRFHSWDCCSSVIALQDIPAPNP